MSAASAQRLRPPPPGFVELAAAVPGVRLEIGYHRASNFTGAPLPGYAAPGAWLMGHVAEDLSRVQAELAPRGLGILCYDAYRPRRATHAMIHWARTAGRQDLLDGYIARHSRHNVGATIDLTLVDLATGHPLEMGTRWDTFTAASHTASATGLAAENRALLHGLMVAHGWQPYSKEWWHFRFLAADGPSRDVPYGADEPDEGAWRAPDGWEPLDP
jgi:D-alanyl-D-alanine dipeptidase